MENFSASAGITWGMNHDILSRLTFAASAVASLNIASSSVFLTRVRLCSSHTQFCHSPHKKPKMYFIGILKEKVSLTVDDWMIYACLAANPLLSAFTAVVAVSLYHN